MAPVLLVVVAHPDDETFGTGSVIANAAAAGARVVVCCATRGEAGEDTSGTTSSPEALAAVREVELRDAARVLGAAEVVLFDFADSGLNGPMPERGLAAVPIEEIVAPVAELIERLQPDVVVTMHPEATNDHRDHMRIGEATTLAFAKAAKPDATLYHWTLSRSLMEEWMAEARTLGILDAYTDFELGLADDEITTIIDVSHVADTRRAGIAAHVTQRSPFEGVSPELQERLFARDFLVRAHPPWNGGPPETRLF
jgi:LmbE family N-acetylglucosaminyl deacetylase